MSEAISPKLSKILAITLLLFIIWATANVVYFALAMRLALRDEMIGAQNNYEEIGRRRLDINALRNQLLSLTESPSVRTAAILSSSDREARTHLQRMIRQSISGAQGRLLSLTDLAAERGSPFIRVQVRVQIEEHRVPQWIEGLEQGELRLGIDELSLMSRSQPTETLHQVEIAATVRARWLSFDGVGP